MRKNCRLIIIIPNLKGHIQKATKEGFILKKYNEYYCDLQDLSGKDPKTKRMADDASIIMWLLMDSPPCCKEVPTGWW